MLEDGRTYTLASAALDLKFTVTKRAVLKTKKADSRGLSTQNLEPAEAILAAGAESSGDSSEESDTSPVVRVRHKYESSDDDADADFDPSAVTAGAEAITGDSVIGHSGYSRPVWL